MSSVVVFEDDSWENFVPLSLTRHVAQQLLGTTTILGQLSGLVEGEITLAGRNLVEDAAKEETGLDFNGPLENKVILVNGRINPLAYKGIKRTQRPGSALRDASGDIVTAAASRERYQDAVSKDGIVSQRSLASLSRGLQVLESSENLLFRYPWEMIAVNDKAIVSASGPTEKKSSAVTRPSGGEVYVSPGAEVEEQVSLDTRGGPIVVEAGARIESLSRVSGPCFIGKESVIRSALIRGGTTVGRGCRVGGEVEQSIVYPYTNKAHLGFLGHSIIGSWVNVGAGTVTSDLKNTYGTVRVVRRAEKVDTGMVKLGAMVGDMAKIASGTMVHCGKSIGVSSHCSGLVDQDVLDFVHFHGGGNGEGDFRLKLQSVIETQSRMMRRRGLELSEARRTLIERLYERAGSARLHPR